MHDFFQSNQDAYESGPLCRLLKTSGLRMNTQLRQLVDDYLGKWLLFLHRFTAGTETEGETGSDTSGKSPLLHVNLLVNGTKLEIQVGHNNTLMTQFSHWRKVRIPNLGPTRNIVHAHNPCECEHKTQTCMSTRKVVRS